MHQYAPTPKQTTYKHLTSVIQQETQYQTPPTSTYKQKPTLSNKKSFNASKQLSRATINITTLQQHHQTTQ